MGKNECLMNGNKIQSPEICTDFRGLFIKVFNSEPSIHFITGCLFQLVIVCQRPLINRP